MTWSRRIDDKNNNQQSKGKEEDGMGVWLMWDHPEMDGLGRLASSLGVFRLSLLLLILVVHMV